MCTVTFIARKNGYALGMNRDEKLTRVKALPPARHEINGRIALFPSEPGGGAWIGVNDAGVTFALINWYSVAARVSQNILSRGVVVRLALAFDDLFAAEKHLARFPLKNTNPFRLLGISRRDNAVIEWRWNLSELKRIVHEWRTNIWISSGFDESGAQKIRKKKFEQANQSQEKTVEWLRSLHASHEPSSGPYSICMHRDDAASVSYTEVEVDAFSTRLAYVPCSLCCARPDDWKKTQLYSGRQNWKTAMASEKRGRECMGTGFDRRIYSVSNC